MKNGGEDPEVKNGGNDAEVSLPRAFEVDSATKILNNPPETGDAQGGPGRPRMVNNIDSRARHVTECVQPEQ